MRIWFLSLFALSLHATVNEPFRWEFLSGYRNDRLHWHLQTGGSGLLNTSQIYRDVQFWENGLSIRTIHRDLAFYLHGSYAAFGKGGTVFQRYANTSFATDEPGFRFNTDGWAADTSGYFGYAANLTPDRTYKVILIPLFGFSAHFERLRSNDGRPNPWTSPNAVGASSYAMTSSLPGTLHLTWYGAFVGGGFQIEPGGRLVFNVGYSYHFLRTRFKASYTDTVTLINPTSQTTQEFHFRSKGGGNLGQSGWAQADYRISPVWRSGLGALVHYYSTELLPTKLHEQTTPGGSSTIDQKLKIRWTSISGWLMVSREF